MLNPLIVGAWDGTHVWLQWTPVESDVRPRYEVRFRFAPHTGQFGEWLPSRMTERYWLAYNTQNLKPGGYVQAEINDGIEYGWQRALGARFVRSVCRFSISSLRRTIHYPQGVIFHCVVDGAVCSYRLQEEIEVEAGQVLEVEMEALASGPWAQIDNAGDFLLRPGLGITVTNIAPSTNDLQSTGVDFARVIAAKRDGPFAMSALPKAEVR